jgi:hypothetical protein
MGHVLQRKMEYRMNYPTDGYSTTIWNIKFVQMVAVYLRSWSVGYNSRVTFSAALKVPQHYAPRTSRYPHDVTDVSSHGAASNIGAVC